MQYIKLSNGQYREFLDSSLGLKWRIWHKDHYLIIACELVSGGFALAEDVGWKTVEPHGTEVTGTYVRIGVGSDGNFKYDIELDATGFAGTELAGNWKNIESKDK